MPETHHMPYLARLFLLTFVFAPAALAGAQEVRLNGETVLRFATVDEGRAALSKIDDYIRAQSRYDRQSRIGTEEEVSDEEFLRFASAAVEPWPAEEIEALTAATASIHKRLAAYRLPLPAKVLLVRTSGKEEGAAAYCRKNTIVLPKQLVSKSNGQSLERLLLHELFHVISSHNPELRKSLYAIIGFKPSPGIEFPASLRDRKITNPDAPTIDYYIEVTMDGKLTAVVPVLYTEQEKYKAGTTGTFFQHMLFKLMLVEETNGKWRAVEKDGRAVVVDPKKVPSFMSQIGGNTNYIIHPDEILADNFVHLALENEKVATPKILADMRRILTAK